MATKPKKKGGGRYENTTPYSEDQPIRGWPVSRIKKVIEYYLGMAKPSYSEAMQKAGGLTKTSANQLAWKWFKHPAVVKIMDERQAELREKSGVTTEMLIEKLKAIAFADLSKFISIEKDGSLSYDFTTATKKELEMIESLSTDMYMQGRGPGAVPVKKFKFTRPDSLRAIEMLGRILGAFKDKVEHTGEVSLVERLQRGREQSRKPSGYEKSDETGMAGNC